MRSSMILCVVFLPMPASAQTPEEKQATIKYVQSLQQPDGGFEPFPQAKTTNLQATSAAVRALKYWGGELPNREKVVKYVKDCFDEKSGAYLSAPGGNPAVNLTAIGILAAAELKLPADPYLNKPVEYLIANAKNFEEIRISAAGLEAAQRFPDDVIKRWHNEVGAAITNLGGGFNWPADDAVALGSTVALVLRTKGSIAPDLLPKVERALAGSQKDDGGFGSTHNRSDLESTYRVMRAFHLLQKKPKDVDKLNQFVASCRIADGGYSLVPGGTSSTVSATYFAGIITHWLK